MGGEKRWPLVEGPPISVGRLVLMLTTVGEQLMFLMKHDIISDNGLCHKCDQAVTGEWKILEMQRLCRHDVMSLWYCPLPEQNEDQKLGSACLLLY